MIVGNRGRKSSEKNNSYIYLLDLSISLAIYSLMGSIGFILKKTGYLETQLDKVQVQQLSKFRSLIKSVR